MGLNTLYMGLEYPYIREFGSTIFTASGRSDSNPIKKAEFKHSCGLTTTRK